MTKSLSLTETLANDIEESQQSSALVQIKEEEEEEDTNKQPATKRTRGQPKSQTKYEGSPKENPKTEGNLDLLANFVFFVMYATSVKWDDKCSCSAKCLFMYCRFLTYSIALDELGIISQ